MAIVLNEKQVGLTTGSLLAIVHAAWSAIVAIGSGQGFLDWAVGLHFIQTQHIVAPFDGTTAVILIALTFIIGSAMGWLFACLWNWWGKQKYIKL